jgi:Asp-tRNA(Asn)/Glu-tRNA(Gln) amidotransferase A subunit family amidase
MAEAGMMFQSLSDIAEQIRRKAVSPVEVTRTVLDWLEHLNPRLNAFMTNLGEQAPEAAKRAEQDGDGDADPDLAVGACPNGAPWDGWGSLPG